MESLEHFLEPYIGAPYSWCLNSEKGIRSPLWKTEPIPTPKEVHAEGICCVGLLNLVRLWDGQSTFADVKHLLWEVSSKLNQITIELPFGALLVRFPHDAVDQGHCAIVWKDQQLLHCYVDDPEPKPGLYRPGICLDPSWKTSHLLKKEGYYDAYVRLEDWLPHPCRCLRGQHSCAPK